MSKWSDGAELLQKIITAKEVIPIQNDLITLQQTMFSLQSDQMRLVDENAQLKSEVEKLKKKKGYKYEDDHSWLIDPARPDLKLCPVCLNRDNFENPMLHDGDSYCATCKKSFE